LSNSSRLICSRLAPSIEAAINRITNNREHQISQAKLAIATANRKLENLESSLLVFQSFAEYELEPPDVGELREEVAARRSDWGQPINFLNLQPLNARSGLLSSKSKNSLKA